MADLRTEIRGAFDKEQSVFPPPPAMRREVVDAVAARQKVGSVDGLRQPNLQWMAVAAAVLITVAIVAGLMSVRLAQRQVPGRPSPPVISPAALRDYGSPPAGVPLIYVIDPRNYAWLQGYDWQGHPRGTVKLSQPVNPTGVPMHQAPDGSGFVVGYNPKGGTTSYLDRLGRPISENSQPTCAVTVDQQTFVWTLSFKVPGQPARQVAVIARDQAIGQTGISPVACSFASDRAILVRNTVSWPSEIWVVRLSDGSVLSHRTYADGQLADVVASADATYIAENPIDTAQMAARQSQGVTRIRRVSDWTQVATVGRLAVRAFSGDDSLVLTTISLLTEIQSGLTVTDWRSGSAVWQYQGSEVLGSVLAQPGGRSFALALMVPTQAQSPLRDVVIVHADGTVTKIPGRYLTLW
ncbi:MAG TPA: hypothetical protein DCF65_10760 [Chloroflexi bacterium]|jgi:hypothetical protein|nr:hypothetical protein [Chloroflexota bacterium]HAF18728.1 hypothetical protein [Chloroflexota bacterium]